LETWVKPNRRILAAGLCGLLATTALGLTFVVLRWGHANAGLWDIGLGSALAGSSALGAALLLWQACRPRIGYAAGKLHVFLRYTSAIEVPIELVECFLLGQLPAELPHLPGDSVTAEADTMTLVIRLRETATEWEKLEVDPALGSWCGGYIVVRGTWSEPLTIPLAHRLNARLHEVQQARTAQVTA